MSLLLVGYLFGFGRSLRTLFWGYLVGSCLVGLIFVGSQAAAFSFDNFCGDGTVSEYEECDDGNYENGDGCNANCHIEEETESTGDEETDEETQEHSVASSRETITPTSTQTKDLKDVNDIFSTITSSTDPLEEFSDPLYFWGKNMHFYNALASMVGEKAPADQRNLLTTVWGGLQKLNQQVLKAKYELELTGLVDMIKYILDWQVDRASLGGGSAHEGGLIQWETPYTADPVAQSPVVFQAATDKRVRRIDWNFGNGKTYACSYGKCSPIPVTYKEAGTYKLRVTISYQDGTTALHQSTIAVGEALPQETTSSDKKRKDRGNIIRPAGQDNYLGPATYLLETNDLTLKVYPMNSEELAASKYTIYSLVTDKKITFLQWDFGNGKTHACSNLDCTQVPTVYKTTGEYSMRLTVEFADGESLTHQEEVVIN